jgi:hypothetical protein
MEAESAIEKKQSSEEEEQLLEERTELLSLYIHDRAWLIEGSAQYTK